MREVLFQGSIMNEEQLEAKALRGDKILHFAANKFQWNIIRGLLQADKANVTSLSTTIIPYYPASDTLVVGSRKEAIGDIEIHYLPFVNLRIVKSLCIAFGALWNTVKWLFKTRGKERVIVTYAMFTPYMLVNFLLGFMTRTPKILVVLDLPEYMVFNDRDQAWPERLLRRLNALLARFMVRAYEGYSMITEAMADELRISRKKPYIVIEGFADETVRERKAEVEQKAEKIVMYAGGLSGAYGIDRLLRAFELIEDEKVQLWLCGSGDCEPAIELLAQKDPRVKFFGVLSNVEVLDLEAKSTVLVNPRPSDHAFTRFSFPSKIMEYMSSGIPVLTTRLPGIPRDYWNHLYVIEDERPEGIAQALKRVLALSDDERQDFGRKARAFVFEGKNVTAQSLKLKKLIDKLEVTSPQYRS